MPRKKPAQIQRGGHFAIEKSEDRATSRPVQVQYRIDPETFEHVLVTNDMSGNSNAS